MCSRRASNPHQYWYRPEQIDRTPPRTSAPVSGFANPVSKELPLEYAAEMNNLIKLEMEGSIS